MTMNRYDFVYLFDVKDANPNGDPDAGNLPRVDPETGHGLVTDVCLKRKVRNYVAIKHGNKSPFEIYFTEGSVLNRTHLRAYQKVGLKHELKKLPKDVEKAHAITAFMCSNFYDIRTFGAVMSTEVNCGQVRGPVQLSFARSEDPIVSSEHAITRSSVTNEADAEKERTMGRKFTVPYALYRAHGFVNPFLAEQRCFDDKDLDLLWDALLNAFQFDQSAARPAGSMAARSLIIFKHEKPLGSAPSHVLFNLVTITRQNESKPARDFSDYLVVIKKDDLPQGVTIIEKP
ncbi:MAG: type I-C CRISPR-associated protein Cas7/Csd2 [Kiritimatiellae bacterium]|nr:type I-C CRISPR-associated protein Cas7/Csd2 [Verrucomicrobiota bacterium]MCG2658764.1 type I-C CRISPR-associated protein Cas7/Csd2 [Kiritimatiellia bacterium]